MQKRQFSPEYKAKIVLEILREEHTVSEIATREEISAKQLHNWKKEFLDNAERVFAQSKLERDYKHQLNEATAREEAMMSKVGRLTLEVDFLKKNIDKSTDATRIQISENSELSITRQCELSGISRGSYYYKPKSPTDAEIEREEFVKSRLDFWHTKMCYLGVRRLVVKLREDGIDIGRKLVKRYMDEMGIYAVYPKPNLSKRNMAHKVFPYLLKNLDITAPNQVWAIDITYVKMGRSHMYLTAIIDWYSRYIVGWELSDLILPRFSMRQKEPWKYTVSRELSILIKAASLPVKIIRNTLRRKPSVKAWTARRGGWTT